MNRYPEAACEGIEDTEGEAEGAENVKVGDVVVESTSGGVVAEVPEFGSAKNTPPWIDEADSMVPDKLRLSNVMVDVKSSSIVVVNSLVVVK